MSDEKPTNPKDAVGIKKVAMSTVPAPFIMGVGAAMTEGALKYGRHNYREAGVRSSVYYDALMRHMTAWWEGEDIDQESGLSHLLKAAACLAVVYDSLSYGNLNDDRPPKHADGWQQGFNSIAEQLMAKYPVPKPAHIAKAAETVTTAEPQVYHGILKPSKDQLHEGETPTHYSTEEGGLWNVWPMMEGPLPRFAYFAKRYSNGDVWDPIVGWR